jgi:hypothetical protein
VKNTSAVLELIAHRHGDAQVLQLYVVTQTVYDEFALGIECAIKDCNSRALEREHDDVGVRRCR